MLLTLHEFVKSRNHPTKVGTHCAWARSFSSFSSCASRLPSRSGSEGGADGAGGDGTSGGAVATSVSATALDSGAGSGADTGAGMATISFSAICTSVASIDTSEVARTGSVEVG